MEKLKGLSPASVFHFFEEISAIPRASGNRKGISDFCVNFARERGLEVWQDAAYNVIIKKPASCGYENAPAVILQGHLDMVTEKTPDCTIDFEKDGLELLVDGDWLTADGTTLGADNGIAVAMALALLDDTSLPHPPLEILLTTDEEVGMLGAMDLDASPLTGKLLLNLDSEEEGIFTAGCAGGMRVDCTLPVEREAFSGTVMTVTVTGLAGGHSGVMIHKGSANACILLGRLLSAVKAQGVRIASLTGGGKDNVIPNEATAKIAVPDEKVCAVTDALRAMGETIMAEYVVTDPNFKLLLSQKEESTQVLTEESNARCVDFLVLAPNGVQTMSSDIEGLVQTSLNLGILSCDDAFVAAFSLRSSITSQKTMLQNKLVSLASVLGGSTSSSGDYPAWEYRRVSPLRDIMVQVYLEQYGEQPVVNVIHAGLECGVFTELIEDLDVVSYGPNIPDIHSVKEKVSISSVQRIWDFTLEVLERIQ